jgi:hypothetical protein
MTDHYCEKNFRLRTRGGNKTKAARVIPGGLWRHGSQIELPNYAAMFGAVDSARGAVEAMVEPDAIGACKVSAVAGAHVALLTADGGFTALQARTLAGIEPAAADALPNALLLVFPSLVDGGGVALHGSSRCSRWGLCKANG